MCRCNYKEKFLQLQSEKIAAGMEYIKNPGLACFEKGKRTNTKWGL
jgi:hypothetical protein